MKHFSTLIRIDLARTEDLRCAFKQGTSVSGVTWCLKCLCTATVPTNKRHSWSSSPGHQGGQKRLQLVWLALARQGEQSWC